MFKSIGILVFIVFFSLGLNAQDITVKGKAVDQESGAPLISATIQLKGKDSTTLYHDITDKSGYFEMKDVKPGPYNLKITYVGYKEFNQQIRVTRKESVIDIGNLNVEPDAVKTAEVEVNATSLIGEQKGDTTQFNASSFKTTKDATTEDLVKKIPGIEVDAQGTVKAQGEQVKKVLVDGKPFFGEDPSLTLKNLPADVVDKVQVYDRASDQAEFTGFDDGETSKTLNILTKSNKRSGKFGKFSGGYGYEDKYNVNANMNFFEGPQRITLLGLSNNVNQQNFSVIDLMDMLGSSNSGRPGQLFRQFAGSGGFAAMGPRNQYFGRGGGPTQNFMVGQQEGISTTHAAGINYSDVWSSNLEVSGSYFFNFTNTENQKTIDRNYLFGQDSNQIYNELGDTRTENMNHRLNFRLDWKIDTNTSFMFRPNISVQNNIGDNGTNSITNSGANILRSSSNSTYYSDYDGYDMNGELLFRHRFGIVGRTISFSLNGGLTNKEGYYDLLNLNTYNRNNTFINDTVNQKSKNPTDGKSFNGNVSYTEPIGANGQMMLSYNISRNKNLSDKMTLNYNYLNLDYDVLDSLLSNNFDNDYIYQKGGFAYRWKNDELTLITGLDYQIASMTSEQIFPETTEISYNFYNLLPSVRINYRPNRQTNVFFRYRTSTNSPSVSQLQNVVNNSNPLQLSVGNPSLKQQVTNSVFFRYNYFSEDFSKVFFVFLNASNRMDYIGQASVLASKDTLINGKYLAPSGAQITRPVNMNGYWNLNFNANYGFPLTFMLSKFNINGGVSYSRTPGLVFDQTNYSNLFNYNFMLMLTSNISEKLDFMISARYNHNTTVNTIQKENNYNYNNWYNTANFKWQFWEGIFIQGELRNMIYGGEYKPVDGNYTLINFSLGKKIFANDAGEIKLTYSDVLNEMKSNETTVTDFYIENVYNTVIKSYLMLTFTYNLSSFKFN